MTDWAERIPAAIEKADEHIANGEKYINRSEIALAQALWEEHGQPHPNRVYDCDACVALRAFVEKVEAP